MRARREVDADERVEVAVQHEGAAVLRVERDASGERQQEAVVQRLADAVRVPAGALGGSGQRMHFTRDRHVHGPARAIERIGRGERAVHADEHEVVGLDGAVLGVAQGAGHGRRADAAAQVRAGRRIVDCDLDAAFVRNGNRHFLRRRSAGAVARTDHDDVLVVSLRVRRRLEIGSGGEGEGAARGIDDEQRRVRTALDTVRERIAVRIARGRDVPRVGHVFGNRRRCRRRRKDRRPVRVAVAAPAATVAATAATRRVAPGHRGRFPAAAAAADGDREAEHEHEQ